MGSGEAASPTPRPATTSTWTPTPRATSATSARRGPHRPGLLQLRRRHLAPDRAQLELHDVRRACARVAAGRPGCGRTWPRTPTSCTLAYWHHPRFNSGTTATTTRSAVSGRRCTTRRRRRPRRSRSRLRALRAAEPDGRPTVRGASASSSSAPAGRTTPVPQHRAEQPGAERRHVRRAATRPAQLGLRLAVRGRAQGGQLHRLGLRRLPLTLAGR